MDNKAELLRLLRLAWAADHVSAADCKKIDALLAAPAEDVHAVGEETVHQVRSHGSCCWEDISGESLEVCRSQAEEYEIRTLYRRPQRLVVLPERIQTEGLKYGWQIRDAKQWNACIDEFERLNKC